jgi:hypothetical protein
MICPICKKNFDCQCPYCKRPVSAPANQVVTQCPNKCSATIYVYETINKTGVAGIDIILDNTKAKTDSHGFHAFPALDPGKHKASISLKGLEDKYALPVGMGGGPIEKNILAKSDEFYTFPVEPVTSLKVIVKRRNDQSGVKGATVKIVPMTSGHAIVKDQEITPTGGEVKFPRLRQDTYKLQVELDDTGKGKLELEKGEAVHALDVTKTPDEIVFWAQLIVHLKLKYKDPDGTERVFPKGFPFTVSFDDNSTRDVKVLDDEGYVRFEVTGENQKKFTLKLDSTKVRYLVHETGKSVAEVKEELSAADLQSLTLAKKKFFALPKTWMLAQSKWDFSAGAVPKDGKIAIPAEGVGSASTPAVLTLLPKLQYVRFQYFDQKYCVSDHGSKAISIPPIVLKGTRESDANGTPQAPVAGTHDTISNWTVDQGDRDKACQCLPWIITRNVNGDELPKLNNKLLLEFGWEDGFIHAASAADRSIETIPATDLRRKPNKKRSEYYDLPKLWKSKCYFTRLGDSSKNRFFDELEATDDPNLEASYAKDTKLTFSLDDIVLLGANQQTVRDKKADGTDTALSEHSRLTVLLLDPTGNNHDVKIHEPRNDGTAPEGKAEYWSKTAFQKENAPSAVRRNAIVELLPVNPRVVIFCSDFYDIFDKRTETATFGNKEVLGARAAKLEDTDVSTRKVVFNQDTDVANFYVHLKRLFHLHYLHYGATDGTTVYGMMITLWTCRFEKDTSKGGTDADVNQFREKGMAHAMDRWNKKNYFFEEADDKKDVVVKHFCVFEAKGVKTGPASFSDTGGEHICKVTVKDDGHGVSSAATTGLTMAMRKSGALDEGAAPPTTEYGNQAIPAQCAFAHELGHAAIGLFDDYITGKVSQEFGSGVSAKKVNDANVWSYSANDVLLDRNGQRCFGMPYQIDGVPMMKTNQSIRLRYYWGRTKWLNDMAAGAIGVFAHLAGKRFRVAYQPPGGAAKLKYLKPNKTGFESIYFPTARTSRWQWDVARSALCDLSLYHLGEDEFSKTETGGPYNGVLALSLKLSASFEVPAYAGSTEYKKDDLVMSGASCYRCKAEHKSGMLAGLAAIDTTKWSLVDEKAQYKSRLAHLASLTGHLQNALQGKFKLTAGSGDFSTTYLRIFPQWEISDRVGSSSAGTHREIKFVFGSKKFKPVATDGSPYLVAGTGCDPKSIVRYLLGAMGDRPSKWKSEGGVSADMTANDIRRLAEWMTDKVGIQFNVANVP